MVGDVSVDNETYVMIMPILKDILILYIIEGTHWPMVYMYVYSNVCMHVYTVYISAVKYVEEWSFGIYQS